MNNTNNYGPLFESLQDSDLVDVLLKQDVDLGFSLTLPDATKPASDVAASSAKAQAAAKSAAAAAVAKKPFYNGGGAGDDAEDDIQKWNALLEIKSDEV